MEPKDFGDVVERIVGIDGLPSVYKEVDFSFRDIERFKEDPVWIELRKRIVSRFFDCFMEWLVEEGAQADRRRGQAIELAYFLKTVDEMGIIPKPKEGE